MSQNEYLKEVNASSRLLKVLDNANESGELPHGTIEEYKADLEAVDKYGQIEGMTAKLLYELDHLMGELENLSELNDHQKWPNVLAQQHGRSQQKINEPIFDYLPRAGASEKLLDAIVELENDRLLPHKTVEAVKIDGHSAIHKYEDFTCINERSLISELKALIDQILPALGSKVIPNKSESGDDIEAKLAELGASEELVDAMKEVKERGDLPHKNLASFYADGDEAMDRYDSLEEISGRLFWELEDLLHADGVKEKFDGSEYLSSEETKHVTTGADLSSR